MQHVPSRTALHVALRRAAHQIQDKPLVFVDPLAVTILGETYAELLRRTPTRPDRPFSAGLRAFVVARSRYAEDNLRHAVAMGVQQYVLLGAGLDTFAYRNVYQQLRTFEVDHPATQAWKRAMLQRSCIAMPENVFYVPVDFERQSLAAQLQDAGFERDAPAFFAWLGVVPYLTPEAFRTTLSLVSGQPQRSGLTLDYIQPGGALLPDEQRQLASLAVRVAQAGEPFRLSFTPSEIAAEFSHFHNFEDLDHTAMNARYFRGRIDQLAIRGAAGRFLTAWL